MSALSINQYAPVFIASSINDEGIELSEMKGKMVLLKFHRFSGCPVAQCQIHEYMDRQEELNAAGIETIVFLHSSKGKVQSNFKEVPGLHIIADKQKTYYRMFHTEFLWKKLFSWASWRVTFTSIFRGYLPHFNKFEGGVTGIPSDFLLDQNRRITDLNYGHHYGDSWSVSEVLSKVQ